MRLSLTQKLHCNVGYTCIGNEPEEPLKHVLFIGFAGETFIPGLAEERRQFVAEVFGTTKKLRTAMAIPRHG